MKKNILFILGISLLLLVGCEDNESPTQDVSKISESTIVISNNEAENQQNKELKIEKTNVMTMENMLVPFDINYSKEYLKILNQYGMDSESYTYMQENSDYPMLIVKDGEEYHAYEYINGSAREITDINDNDIFDSGYLTSSSYGITALSATIDEYNRILEEYSSLEDKDFDSFMKEKYENDKELGSASYPYDYLDGAEPGVEKATGYIEDGQYKVFVEDIEKNRKTTITIKGIDGDIAYVKFSTVDEISGIPGIANILTMNGDVYSFNIADALPEYFEENVESEEELTAVKNENVKNAVSLIYTYLYPFHIVNGEGMESSLFALTYDGELYRLDQWIDM